jgi:hypothetical protein
MNQSTESSGANCGGNMPLMSTSTTSRTNAVGKVAAEDYASEQQKTELQKLRRWRLDLQVQLEDVAAAEAAILVELEQVATAGGEPDLLDEIDSSGKHQIEQSRPTVLSSAFSELVAARKSQVDDFFEFTSAREKLRENADKGLKGAEAYAGLPSQYADLYSRNQVHNVDRAADPPTRGFLILTASLLSICDASPHRYALLVFHYAFWRMVAGTVPFARLVGFLYSWTSLEEHRVRDFWADR